MKKLYYIRYFLYIAWNWNLRLALFSIYHEYKGEKKYGLDTTRLNDLQQLTINGKNLQFAEVYQGANYYLLEQVFAKLKLLKARDGFADIGCGKGRVLVVAAYHGFKQITGIEFAKELWIEAVSNCNRMAEKFPDTSISIIHQDAATYTFGEHLHVFFFFNPFQAHVMALVVANILKSIKKSPRKVWVVYMNPQHKTVLLNNGFREVAFMRKMQFVEAAIYEKGP
ncbi:MAG TPA: class I SAM-dependent methyltransferase [Chitinophagaceae bacterium]|nr:class I SAM-dependent methyltransferase [Chitinophagaceae bacterium]